LILKGRVRKWHQLTR